MSASGIQRAVVRTARLLAFAGVLLHATLIPWAAAAMALATMPAPTQGIICNSAVEAAAATGDPSAPAERSGHCELCKATSAAKSAIVPVAPLVAPTGLPIAMVPPRAATAPDAAALDTPRNRGPPTVL
jgi:hypothetical protein